MSEENELWDIEEPLIDDCEDSALRRFQDVDLAELHRVEQGGRRRSQSSEDWARRTFDEWRRVKKIDYNKSIEDLSEETDVREFVDNLTTFFLQVNKKDGTLYPPTTIQALLRAIGRVIRARQEQRCVETGLAVHPFNILKDSRYHKVKLAADEAVQRSMDRGLGKSVKKSDILTLEEETRMLAQPKCDLQYPKGLNYVMAYYCLRNFFIRGVAELRQVNWEDFTVENLGTGPVLRFTPGTSKNWKVDVARCGADNLRRPVDCQAPQVIDCFVQLSNVRPKWHTDEPPPHPLFLTPKQRRKSTDLVWYLKSPVGVNTLSSYMKEMVEDLPDISHKAITNKSGRGVGISRMVQSGVPTALGMLQTGHRDPKSFIKYDQTSEEVKNRAMQRIICGEVRDGRILTFDEALADEMSRLAKIQEQDVRTASLMQENLQPNVSSNLIPEHSFQRSLVGEGSCPQEITKVPEIALIQADNGAQEMTRAQITKSTKAITDTFVLKQSEGAAAGETMKVRSREEFEEFLHFERHQSFEKFQEYERFKHFQSYKKFREFQGF
ncbi:hypothetical protein R1sor_003432 [Riccia sorocarpa]|uniref:DUF3504 domain-containing protein n=1 Tax=Riccia sorocarpa TaxID=122646 RepID=A0ABD3H1K8_9MARC